MLIKTVLFHNQLNDPTEGKKQKQRKSFYLSHILYAVKLCLFPYQSLLASWGQATERVKALASWA